MKPVNKKCMVLFTIVLFLILAIAPGINSKTIPVETTKTFFKDKSELTVNCLDASSPYDYGLKTGRQFRLQYKLLDILTHLLNKASVDERDIEKQISSLEKYCPDFLEELKGLSQGCNIKIERLLSIQKFLSYYMGRHCSVSLSTSPATKNNQTFLAQNWDVDLIPFGLPILPLIHRWFSYRLRIGPKPFFIHEIKNHYRYVHLGIPILYEIFLMNEKGLGFGAMITSLNETRHIDEGDGIPTYVLERRTMMTCKNVSEVANFWKNSERLSNNENLLSTYFADFDTTAWCDREGGILIIEQSHNHIATVFGNSTDITNASEGILWHCLHHQWLDPNLTGSKYPWEMRTSNIRTNRIRELLEEYHGNITLDVCKRICRDHGGGFDPDKPDPADICWHPDRDNPTITAFSWIIQPKDLTVYLTHRIPCKGRYWKYDFSKIFEN